MAALSTPEAAREVSSPQFLIRIQLARATPSLRGAIWAASANTEEAICEALVRTGTPGDGARAATGAVMGAATAILLAWAAETTAAGAAETLIAGLSSLLEPAR